MRPINTAAHINLAELDAVLKGVNLALQCWIKMFHMQTCVYYWVSDILTAKARVRIKAASEMLIKRRLDTIKKLLDEYDLLVDVTLVISNCNFADRLTRIPQR